MAANDQYTKSLLHFDGNLTDESGKTWTAYGGAATSTAQKKFGTHALYLDGTDDYINTYGSSDFAFGTGDFTVDFWANIVSYPSRSALISCKSDPGSSYGGWNLGWDSGGGFQFRNSSDSSLTLVAAANAPSAGTWNHFALVKKTGYLGLAINGSFAWISYSASVASLNDNLCLGREFPSVNDYYLNYYIDELRISKGIARWTSNFTPPTVPYGATVRPCQAIGGF